MDTQDLKKRLLGELTEEQIEIAETLDAPLFVAAGAGSGKTTTLTKRVVWALSPGSGKDDKPYLDSIDQLLVITYTHAAASEIKERIRASLRDAGLGKEALKIDNAWVTTIHGMCSRLIRRHAYTLGLDPDFDLLSDSEKSNILDQIIDEVMEEEKNSDSMSKLLDSYNLKPSFNKKKSALCEITSMIKTLVSKANASLEGFDSIKFYSYDESFFYTEIKDLADLYGELHSIGSKNENQMQQALSSQQYLNDLIEGVLPQSFKMSVTDDDLAAALFKPHKTSWKGDASYVADDIKQKRMELLLNYNFYHNQENQEQIFRIAKQVYERYRKYKRINNKFVQDDLLTMAMELLNIPEISQMYSDQFKLVMIDEFQDTNTLQVELIKRLSGKNEQHLCTVGDSQQSIYKFNGADVSVFTNRQKSLSEDMCKTMHTNFRSHDDILRFVNHMCGKESMIPNFMDLEAGRRIDNPSFKDKTRVYVEYAEDKNELYPKLIADRLEQLHKEGVALGDMALLLAKMFNAPKYIDELRARGLQAVITGGSNFKSAPEVEEFKALLHTLSNPQDTNSGLFPLLTGDIFRLDASDILLLSTYYDEENNIIRKQPIYKSVMDKSIYKDMQMSPRLRSALEVLDRAWSRLDTTPLDKILLDVVHESGWLHRVSQQGVAGQGVLANILAAIDYIKGLSCDAGLGIGRIAKEFDIWLKFASEQPAVLYGDKLDAISVTTIHKSKGLEYPVVAIGELRTKPIEDYLVLYSHDGETSAALRPRNDPAKKLDYKIINEIEGPVDKQSTPVQDFGALLAAEKKSASDEAARLLYVALTRAKECVILSMPNKSKNDTGISSMMQDAFGEIPDLGTSMFNYGGSQPGVFRHASVDTIDDMLAHDDENEPSQVEVDNPEPSTTDDEGPIGTFDLVEIPDYQTGEFVQMYSDHDMYSYSSSDPEAIDVSEIVEGAKVYGSHGEDESESSKQGNALDLGSAFHEAAEFMILTQRELSDEEINHFASIHHLSNNQSKRLSDALELWSGSSVREEALRYKHQEPEAPFAVKVSAVEGEYIQGAIDLLCYSDLDGEALVVDYKTGDRNISVEDIKKRHALQANYYAHVLFLQGFKKVTCKFVCVEIDGGDSQPLVVEYSFDSIDETKINA